MLYSGMFKVMARIRIRFSVWLDSGYVHVFILFSVIIVSLPSYTYYGLWTGASTM